MHSRLLFPVLLAGLLAVNAVNAGHAQSAGAGRGAGAPAPQAPAAPTRADILRGGYGPYRANNDLLSYDLSVRVDPEKKFIRGRNTIRFRMLETGTRIQLDLFPNLAVDKIVMGQRELKYEREEGAVFVDFPETLAKNKVYAIDFYYSGNPTETGRFGGIAFRKDSSGHAWVNTACQHIGSSVWWPSKDQQRDEVENMRLSVEVPSGLADVSNGKFLGKKDLGDGYTRYDWFVQYPINNYCVSLNIGNYVHFTDTLGHMTLDFYCFPQDLEKARKQFPQAKTMIEAYQKYFGEYPFKKDGYKLVQAPYSGMEHQTAVTYGNHFVNGYLERDWTGVGISTRFDFIIIHESAHEWWGNSVTAADVSDEWIHEAWGTYAEGVYVEHMWGKDDALRYLNGYKRMVRNQQPILTQPGTNRVPPQDMYFKGALFINTLRSVVNDDARWWRIVHQCYERFKYRDIMTPDMVAFFNQATGRNLTPVFDQYLRYTSLPALELEFRGGGEVAYRWKADAAGFAMPVKVGKRGEWQIITPTAEWQTLKTPLTKDEFDVATDLYLVDVTKKAEG
jgi:aminopeptidase N